MAMTHAVSGAKRLLLCLVLATPLAFAQGAFAQGQAAPASGSAAASAAQAAAPAGASAAQRLLPASALLPPAFLADFARDGKLVRAAMGKAEPGLLPAHPAAEAVRGALASEKPSVLVEAVFLYKRPVPVDPAAELRAVYGILGAINTLEGVEYWSESRKTMRVFYAESYRVDGPETRRRLPDSAPPAGALPASEGFFAFQRDLSFGANVYRYEYRSLPGAILLESRNLTRMSYGIVPVLGPEALGVRLLVVPAEDGILFYAASSASAALVPGLRGKLENSFSNRAEALFRWFSARMAAAAK